jgi:hypothetical protein
MVNRGGDRLGDAEPPPRHRLLARNHLQIARLREDAERPADSDGHRDIVPLARNHLQFARQRGRPPGPVG